MQKKDTVLTVAKEQEPIESKYCRSIEQTISQVWRPPVGIKKGTQCRVALVVNSLGRVAQFDVIHASGIPLYDLSIIRVMSKMVFDKPLHTKRFTVCFKQ